MLANGGLSAARIDPVVEKGAAHLKAPALNESHSDEIKTDRIAAATEEISALGPGDDLRGALTHLAAALAIVKGLTESEAESIERKNYLVQYISAVEKLIRETFEVVCSPGLKADACEKEKARRIDDMLATAESQLYGSARVTESAIRPGKKRNDVTTSLERARVLIDDFRHSQE